MCKLSREDTKPQQPAVCVQLISQLDCSVDPPSPVCSSNGTTFPTRCSFAKAHCGDSNIHLVHEGDCLPAEIPHPDPVCTELLNNFVCPKANAAVKVCATDEKTYPNLCEFEKARCTNQTLRMLKLGSCGNPNFELICQAIQNEACPDDVKPVCGSNSVTYDNACKLEKAACNTPGLHLVDDHPC
ncbi:thrombin inhibitor rhodniin-like [Littorina saxatilis]|uniref:thrombin inhibitor rhodniin-like n=1 Tax=Littorina saxatilis TaxID=31220 RepID=UPI0038B4A0FD